MKYGFGIDLGGTTVKIAYFDENGTMLDKWEIPTVTANGGDQILPDIAASVKEYLTSHKIPASDILGIGIGVPGAVNGKGVVNRCVNLGWGVFNIAEDLSKLTGFPVKAGNDANVAALGEYWKGGGKGCDNMLFVTLGTGVGGGIVVDGNLLHGAHGSGAEIGHLLLNRDETLQCNCGKYGCVEQYCSATGVVRLAQRHLAATDAPSSLRALENMTCKDIFDAGKAGTKRLLPFSIRSTGTWASSWATSALSSIPRWWSSAAVSARQDRCFWTVLFPTSRSTSSTPPPALGLPWLLWATMPAHTALSSWHWMPSESKYIRKTRKASAFRVF